MARLTQIRPISQELEVKGFTMLETGRIVTIWFMALALVASLIYDLWAGTAYGSQATISAIVLDVSRQYPILPFAAGVLAGHLFAPQ